MKTVGIICEYNPFHLGHRIQIEDIRRRLGNETCIIALMSGSFVERGGPAILSKEKRAEIALSEGINLVLELPFPWSMSGADRFAAGAIAILEGLGNIDYLAFGSECGNIEVLAKISRNLRSEAFEEQMKKLANERPDLSYAALRELAYKAVTGEELTRLPPNDLLGVAYLSHLKRIKPLVLIRLPGYSASGARSAWGRGESDALEELVPNATVTALTPKDPVSTVATDRAVLAHLRMADKTMLAAYAECTPELASDLKNASRKAVTVEEIVKAATSKRYTSARVRRGLWHSFLRTPKDAPLYLPHFTNLLGADSVGREYLRSIAKTSEIAVITKLSDAKNAENIMDEYVLSDTADEVYAALHGISIAKRAPIIK